MLIHGRSPLGGRPALRRPALFGLAALGNSKVELVAERPAIWMCPRAASGDIVR
jgi:hypothetical protein